MAGVAGPATRPKLIAVNLVGAFVLPFLILGVGAVVSRSVLQWGGFLDTSSAVVGVVVGVTFLVRQFRATGAVLAIRYVPVLLLSMLYFGLFVVGALYGLSL